MGWTKCPICEGKGYIKEVCCEHCGTELEKETCRTCHGGGILNEFGESKETLGLKKRIQELEEEISKIDANNKFHEVVLKPHFGRILSIPDWIWFYEPKTNCAK